MQCWQVSPCMASAPHPAPCIPSPSPRLTPQGEPELERLKRELDELKNAPRGLEGTFRTQAEMERHRHQMADAAIEEQLELQTAFREQQQKLQALYDRRQRAEYEIRKR